MRYQQTNERRAVILMVVLSLLTLFAIVGITFVLYADAEAAAARVAREAETAQRADVDPQQALSFFLSQFIYDANDTTGVGSALRGHSLARTMYGYNYTTNANIIPFDGVGRLHTTTGSYYNPYSTDDYLLVNYTWFSGDGFIRDPERYGTRANPTILQTNGYVSGNAPYTYPDLNNMYLAAVTANGQVLAPSFHRNYTGFGTLAPTNPNWFTPSATNPALKYMVLRPRPADHNGFPAPDDAGGDVKNLVWAPGGNDSIWIDLGAPVMTAPDGTTYKMLFAPLIIDLDNRINLNTAGNILAYGPSMTAPASWQQASGAHVSNQGWGSWEVNLSRVLYGEAAGWTPPPLPTSPATPPEWMRLLTGMSYVVPTPPNIQPVVQPGVVPPVPPPPNTSLTAWLLPGVSGRYVQNGAPVLPPLLTTPSSWTPTTAIPPANTIPLFPSAVNLTTTYPHFYAQSDFNGLNEASLTLPYVPSSRPAPPSVVVANPALTTWYPIFLQGYLNGSTENINHPLLFNAFQSPLAPSVGTRVFRASDMEPLLRPNSYVNGTPVDANASELMSDLIRLCPSNLGSTAASMRYRNLVTTQSWDLGTPGVTPYWWNTGYMIANPNVALTIYAPFGSSVQFPTQAGNWPPSLAITNSWAPTLMTGANPMTSEFDPGWGALSANSMTYQGTQYAPPVTGSPFYTTPGARIRLNRPLPPYPHMGAGLTPPYIALPPTTTTSPYGVAYNLTPNNPIYNQYVAAQNARQALANDIYRRLLAIAGIQPVAAANVGSPLFTDLSPRRWLAQLAVNIVDFMDEDDIMTPFNFYTTADGLPANALGTTMGLDDPGTPNPTTNNYLGNNTTGANPSYWVFGTELPKVVLNEVLAEAQNSTPTQADPNNPDYVNVWLELFNTMPDPVNVANPTTSHTQPQDGYRVPLYITNPNGASYSPYRITIAQTPMNQPPAGSLIEVSDASSNPLGKAYVAGTYPQSTTDADFSGTIPLIGGGNQALFPVPGTGTPPAVNVNAGVDATNDIVGATTPASPFFLVGPLAASSNPPYPSANYQDPFVAATAQNPAGVPANTPVLRTNNMTVKVNWTNASTTDERTTGLTVMLRRLANPYLPPQTNPGLPNYNPYVTVDYIQSVAIRNNNVPAGGNLPNPPPTYQSRGKEQPYAGLTLPLTPPNASAVQPISPVMDQLATSNPAAAPGAIVINNVTNTFGYANWPPPPSGHYDWLVHLDRPPISPMELLHVSGYPPYYLTQYFMQGSDNLSNPAPPIPPSPGSTPPSAANALNMFRHYAPWLDAPPAGQTTLTMQCPWWFDSSLTAGTQSHRLYRLFEFLECGDRAFGVNGLGRIPGKVNINTIWDPEILQALLDANLSMGITPYVSQNPPNGLDPVAQIFNNLIQSRSPSAVYNLAAGTYSGTVGPVNMGTGKDDRPFLPLSAGLVSAGAGTQFPNGIGITTDTVLRANPTANSLLLFQNPTDTAVAVHPYLQTQLLTKLYNNVTTRSNTFAVFLTVGFFQVTNPLTSPPTLGAEIGRSEGRQIRHRMFAIVDRTNLSSFTTTGQVIPPATAVTGPSSLTNPPNYTGQQIITLSSTPPITVVPGAQLVIDAGTVNEESVVVQTVVGNQITANFALPHAASFSVIQRGNPGPWIVPYDPRLDPSVVPYFSIID
ncbi:MAG TPA: hypothetical protein VMF69_07215 [Gemmataceae bacterium]|nr:hypothetical protein [Gemmataceae bacterium]